MYSGSCLCGKVEFEVRGLLNDISLCHCSICQKASGSAFSAYGATPIKQFAWLRGESSIREIEVSDQCRKVFCGNCGSTMITWHQSEPDLYHVSLGTLDESHDITIEYHQFAGSKADWYVFDDSHPQYEKWPPESN